MRNEKAVGVIFAGDLTSGGTEERFQIFYSLLELYTGDRVVIANGNHDCGQFKDSAEHREIALRYRNAYLGPDTEKDYYSTEIKGYKAIVMGDEGEKANHFGHSGKGCGMHVTIRDDKILVQGRNYETGEWLEKYVYLVDPHPEADDDGPVAPQEPEKDADAISIS